MSRGHPWDGQPSATAETLPQLLDRRLGELGLSYRAAAAQSAGLVSGSTLNNIVAGRVLVPKRRSLEGAAKALGLPLSRLLQVTPDQSATRPLRHPLQRLVAARVAELGINYGRAAARSGGLVSRSAFWNLGNGMLVRPPAAAISGIAKALDLPLETVEAAYYEEADPA